ncbi:MAG: RagB/SusD family nutrient uptake outer membrane protein [Fluviicola sp. XM-24bin1]|nr:MAG: RagB/SusD family nutrient uptake outer membrane protein [Fluviicola sp. XM-24bin1]
MKTIKYTSVLLAAVLLVGMSSCKKQLNQTPKYGLNSEVVYSDPANYINVLAKIYSGLSVTGIQGPAGNGDISGIDEGFSAYVRVLYNLQELPTDESVCGWNDPGIPEMNRMQWSADNAFVKAMYARIFYQITLCNEFIRESSDEKMTERGFTDAQQEEIRTFRNEARFLRALAYTHAMDLFGNVPFVTEADLVGGGVPEQIQRAALFEYIEGELLDLENLLLDPAQCPYGRASKAAAQFLMAKNYLNAEVYTGLSRASNCLTYCQKVMDWGYYQLDDNYQDIFLADNETSPEIIFPVTFDGMFTQTYGGTTFLINASIGGSMIASQYGTNGGWQGLRTTRPFVEKFPDTTQDSRFLFYRDGQTLDITNLGTFTEGYAFPKFRNITSTGNLGSNANAGFSDVDFPMMRLADVYLMYMEAALRGAGNTGTGETLFNQLRERAYGNSSFNITGVTLDDVLDERARELSWECTRRTDLIRFGRYTEGSYVWPFKGGDVNGVAASSHLNLYPIPTSDIILNPNLAQNPGY